MVPGCQLTLLSTLKQQDRLNAVFVLVCFTFQTEVQDESDKVRAIQEKSSAIRDACGWHLGFWPTRMVLSLVVPHFLQFNIVAFSSFGYSNSVKVCIDVGKQCAAHVLLFSPRDLSCD